jgi:CheY-like chemotaxis protein
MTPEILIVEDTPELSDIFSQVFRLKGLSTEVIGDGRSALARLDSAPPRAVILDLNMPEVSGLEVLRQIRSSETWKRVPVIVVTADWINSREAEDQADLVLLKPVTIDQLFTLVDRFLEPGGTGPLTRE